MIADTGTMAWQAPACPVCSALMVLQVAIDGHVSWRCVGCGRVLLWTAYIRQLFQSVSPVPQVAGSSAAAAAEPSPEPTPQQFAPRSPSEGYTRAVEQCNSVRGRLPPSPLPSRESFFGEPSLPPPMPSGASSSTSRSGYGGSAAQRGSVICGRGGGASQRPLAPPSGATTAQLQYLESLCRRLGLEWIDVLPRASTVRSASLLIDELKDRIEELRRGQQ